MSYLSIEFSLFFIAVFGLYWGMKRSILAQNLFLLLVSYFIVGLLNINFALILAGYTSVIYFFAYRIEYSIHKKRYFVFAIVASIVNLMVFKYFDFFRGELQAVFQTMGIELYLPTAELLLPIGISFYTFHSITYLVSLYKKELPLIPFFDFALFLSFFPSIVAGPINRANVFLPQILRQKLSETVDINGERAVIFIDREIKQRRILEPYKAFTLLILALIKVYWLSSWIEQYCVNPIFNSPMEYHSFDLLLGIYCYSIQIYLNFSGYTDLVTGIALLLGFRLPINFNLPYLAKNVKKFWQRWHISLSTWIRDYIYFPLGGSRCSFTRTQCNVFIAMLLSGLWHGAGLNFIVWGIIHGVGMISLNIFNRFWGEDRISQFSPPIARLLTFHFICFTWIFFRSTTISEAFDFLTALFSHFNGYPMQFNSLVIIIVLLMAFISYPYWAKLPHYFSRVLMRIHWALIPMILIPIIWLIVYFAPSGIPLFIYGGF